MGEIEVVEKPGESHTYSMALLVTFPSAAELRDAISKGGAQLVWEP